MPNITTGEIVDRARAAADMRDDFVTLSQWMYWMNVEHRSLQVRIARMGYVLQESSVDITAVGDVSYPIDEPLAVIGVYEVTSAGFYRRLRAVNPQDGHRQATNAAIGPAQEWIARRDPTPISTFLNVSFFPNPSQGTYRIFYVAHPPKLVYAQVATDGTNSVDYPLSWEEAVVLRLARRALAKEESDTQDIDAQIAASDRDIEESIFSRQLMDAPVIRNVDKRDRGWWQPYPYPWPPVSQWTFV